MRYLVLISIAIALLVGAVATSAQSDSYTLPWTTADGGGVMFSIGGPYTLGSTLGQPDAGTASGGPYTLTGGFWIGAETLHRVYLPLVVR